MAHIQTLEEQKQKIHTWFSTTAKPITTPKLIQDKSKLRV
jgi:hypothetical protein